VTTIAGTGNCAKNVVSKNCFKDGPALKAEFNQPHGLAFDKKNNILYISDYLNHRIRKLDLNNNAVSTIAGTGEAGFRDGKALEARFDRPYGLLWDSSSSSLYITEYSGNRIRRLQIQTPTP